MSPPQNDGYALAPGTLGEIAQRLEGASQGVEATATGAPAAVDAGDCTAAVAETLAFLADSLGGVVDGLGSAADATIYSQGVYARAEEASTVQPCRPDDGTR
jgi:hypothetical protein